MYAVFSYLYWIFATRRSALARHVLWRRACVSVTLVYCTQTTEPIIMRLLLDCSPAIPVFPYQMCSRQLDGIPLIEGVKWENGKQKSENLANKSQSFTCE